MSLDCVLDASVGVKVFLVEPLSAQADALFAHVVEGPSVQLYVPDLFFVECTNILWKYVRWHGYPAQNAHEDVADLLRLPLHTVSSRELVSEAMSVAVAHKITAYDALYVALSRQLSLPMVTADKSLVRRLEGSSSDVRWLGEWPGFMTGNGADGRLTDAPG
jgi:predicted nucleic acid-binding protein